MENVKIFLDNNVETVVNGIFYVFNSKYYFIYTTGEMDDNEYVRLYVAQVCKEIKNTPTGPIDTGYMLGMEISNSDEWVKVQESITKIVNDKKSGTQSAEIQYLPMSMLVNFKIVGKNKFKLMKNIVEENFKVVLPSTTVNPGANNNVIDTIQPIQPIEPEIEQRTVTQEVSQVSEQLNYETPTVDNGSSVQNEPVASNPNSAITGEVIIDYRARFFEEQEKNNELQDQIKILNEKLDNIKSILG